MTLRSYRRPDNDGWRYSTGYRCRRISWAATTFEVQKWSGDAWIPVAKVESYEKAREVEA